jgi:hypothetical protein
MMETVKSLPPTRKIKIKIKSGSWRSGEMNGEVEVNLTDESCGQGKGIGREIG